MVQVPQVLNHHPVLIWRSLQLPLIRLVLRPRPLRRYYHARRLPHRLRVSTLQSRASRPLLLQTRLASTILLTWVALSTHTTALRPRASPILALLSPS